MLNILSSSAVEPNEQLHEVARLPRENNLDWIQRNMPDGDGILILLLGGRDPISFRLRVAQAELRDDLSPSSWSHVVMFAGLSEKIADTPVIEISLNPGGGFDFPAVSNGVQEGKLGQYRNSREWPNLALVRIPISKEEFDTALRSFKQQRVALDAVELMVAWLAYAWGAGNARNPLQENIGIPSAALLETVTSGAGYDLTPGLESRASCPEAIWQSIKWWHNFYTERHRYPPRGAWIANHRLG
jgi:hypothetical protein